MSTPLVGDVHVLFHEASLSQVGTIILLCDAVDLGKLTTLNTLRERIHTICTE